MNTTWMAVVACAGVATCGEVQGDLIWTGSQEHRAASVAFGVVGNELEVRLTNTSLVDALVPVDVLTAVFFNVSGGSVSLSPVSAMLSQGSIVLFGGAEGGGGVGGEWAFRSSPMSGYSTGISSSGLGLFGPGDRFPGANLQGPESPNGLQYGLTSAGDNPATGNTPMTGTNALIQNSVVFRLGGLPAGFNLGRINSVLFQYGTSLSEPSFPGVPGPGAAGVLAAAGILAARRRRPA